MGKSVALEIHILSNCILKKNKVVGIFASILRFCWLADDNNRPYLTSRCPGTNDYINAVYVDVSRFGCYFPVI